jgi:hypothetical protein
LVIGFWLLVFGYWFFGAGGGLHGVADRAAKAPGHKPNNKQPITNNKNPTPTPQAHRDI